MAKKKIILITLLFFIITPFHNLMSDQHTEEIPTDSQMDTEKKPKTPPDLDVLKKHAKVFMGSKDKNGECIFEAQSKVKNVGDTNAAQSTLRFKRAGKEYTTFKIEKSAGLMAGKSSFTKKYKDKKKKIVAGKYTWTFTVDKVSGEVNTANNEITFDCDCPSKVKPCKKKKKK